MTIDHHDYARAVGRLDGTANALAGLLCEAEDEHRIWWVHLPPEIVEQMGLYREAREEYLTLAQARHEPAVTGRAASTVAELENGWTP